MATNKLPTISFVALFDMNNAPYQTEVVVKRTTNSTWKLAFFYCFRTPIRCQKVIFQETTSWRQRRCTQPTQAMLLQTLLLLHHKKIGSLQKFQNNCGWIHKFYSLQNLLLKCTLSTVHLSLAFSMAKTWHFAVFCCLFRVEYEIAMTMIFRRDFNYCNCNYILATISWQDE